MSISAEVSAKCLSPGLRCSASDFCTQGEDMTYELGVELTEAYSENIVLRGVVGTLLKLIRTIDAYDEDPDDRFIGEEIMADLEEQYRKYRLPEGFDVERAFLEEASGLMTTPGTENVSGC